MGLPVDIKAVVEEALDVEAKRQAPLSVSLYFDDTTPGELQAHVRQVYATSAPHAHVSIIYLDGRPFVPYGGDDMAVLVAGVDERVGRCAEELREAGVPTMVATTMPTIVEGLAEVTGHPIPAGDLVAPAKPEAQDGEEGAAAQGDLENGANPEATVAPDEPILFDEAAAASLDERMGQWIAAACKDKGLAFAAAFPFVRRPLALDKVEATTLQNAVVGFLPIIPGADMPVMTLNQSKMIMEIAAAYGLSMDTDRIKELVAVVVGAFACRKVSRSVAPDVPVLGWAVKALIGGAATYGLGRGAIQYYEDGATFATLEKAAGKARDKAADAVAAYASDKAQEAVAGAVDGVKQRVGSVVDDIAGAVGAMGAAGGRAGAEGAR